VSSSGFPLSGPQNTALASRVVWTDPNWEEQRGGTPTGLVRIGSIAIIADPGVCVERVVWIPTHDGWSPGGSQLQADNRRAAYV
jgi:hypothetical protein